MPRVITSRRSPSPSRERRTRSAMSAGRGRGRGRAIGRNASSGGGDSGQTQVQNIEGRTEGYIRHLFSTYGAEIDRLKVIDLKKRMEENPKLSHALYLFATAQDSVYGGAPTVTSSFGPSLTDDVFEIFLMEAHLHKVMSDDLSEFSPAVMTVMHDAWALARLFQFDASTGKLEAFGEGGTGEGAVELGEIDPTIITGNKALVRVPVPGIEGEAKFQIRRLEQFVNFDDLTSDEQVKDKTPYQTFRSLGRELTGFVYKELNTIKLTAATTAVGGRRGRIGTRGGSPREY